MTIVGAIFAGGAARRFGSDKALAAIDGEAMIDRIARAIARQCDIVVVVGRAWRTLPRVEDVPHPGLGPLGALAGALDWAQSHGHWAVLTTACDLPDLPDNLLAQLSPAPAFIKGQPMLGLWESARIADLRAYLDRAADRSLRGWIAATGARAVEPATAIANINMPEDLERYLAGRSSSR